MNGIFPFYADSIAYPMPHMQTLAYGDVGVQMLELKNNNNYYCFSAIDMCVFFHFVFISGVSRAKRINKLNKYNLIYESQCRIVSGNLKFISF